MSFSARTNWKCKSCYRLATEASATIVSRQADTPSAGVDNLDLDESPSVKATSHDAKSKKLESVSLPQDYLSEKNKRAETEVWVADTDRKKELVVAKELREIEEKELPVAETTIEKPVDLAVSPQSASTAETEHWHSEELGSDPHKSAVDVRAWVDHAEARGSDEDRTGLFGDGESRVKTTDAEGNSTPSLPETEVFESEAESEHLMPTEKEIFGPLSPSSSELSATKGKVPSLDLQKEDIEQRDSESEKIPPSEDELSVTEDSFLQALKAVEGEVEEIIPPAEAKRSNRLEKASKKSHPPRLPSSFTRKLFQHFSGMRIPREALDALESCCDAYFEQLTDDLLAYSDHAGRKTIEPQDVELLLRRQGFVTNERSLYALVEKHLPLEYRQEIIPMATANNVIIPKK